MHLPWAGRLFQIGYVVPDLRRAMLAFKANLGITHFLVRENTSLADQRYMDARADFKQSIAFCYTGDMQVELIQPLSGPSTYTDFLERCPEGGVQHLGYRVDDLDAAVAAITARGFRAVQSGSAGSTRLAYFHGPEMHGTAIELLQIHEGELATFERLKRGEVGITP